jgi:hypothetical protein
MEALCLQRLTAKRHFWPKGDSIFRDGKPVGFAGLMRSYNRGRTIPPCD